MFSLLTYFTFFVRRSFKNLVYKDICYKVSLKGMMISNLLKMSRKQAKYYSFSFFDGTKRYGTSFTGTDRISFLSSLANWLLVLESKTSSPLFLLLFFFSFFIFFSLYFQPLISVFFSLSSSLTSSNTPSALFSFPSLSLIWLLVKTVIHSSLGFFLVLTVKLHVDLSFNYLANWPTCTFRLFMANSVLLWFDRETCINWLIVSCSLVVFSYTLGPWLGGRIDKSPWSLLKLFLEWDLKSWPWEKFPPWWYPGGLPWWNPWQIGLTI